MEFKILKDLVNHLRYSHFVTSSDTLQCKQNGCNQLFSSFKTFKFHIQKVHISTEACTKTVQPNTKYDFCENDLAIPSSSAIENFPGETVQTPTSFNLLESLNDMKEKALHFSLYLHAEDNMTRSDVLSIQKKVTTLCSSIKNVLHNCLVHNVNNDGMLQEDVIAILQFCENPFAEISTEHHFFKHLKKLHLYEDPLRHELSNHVTTRVVKGNPTLVGKSFSAYFMPLRFQLKTFFECPGILASTLKNTESIMSKNKISNFINGESYKNKIKSFAGKTVIPIFLYFDDYGINNPLGSHSTSILAGYYSFPTIPQYLQSRLQFIFNCAFINTNDYKQFGNDVSFHYIIEELTFLEKEGILINNT